MHSNNEVGTLQPIAEIAQIAKRKSGSHRIAIHTDAAQSVGKVPLNVNDLSVGKKEEKGNERSNEAKESRKEEEKTTMSNKGKHEQEE